ncbi:myosin head-domain-containing protein [Phakopsora pachyrhizi]|uniref:Myosin head-domain-containing protein n=1 Tax=Phakopsora pachyrhizi TaxID=170000 RepID=A0AAV0BUY8_PHAPC|nr:myosin head-domain-containing protein [Phakopsora pachyrhizi]
MRKSVRRYSLKVMSATALFLATKVEEVPIKLEYIFREYLRIDENGDEIQPGNLTPDGSEGRIVGQIDDERNFHNFYQFTKGASPQQREEYGIQEPAAYYYTSRAGCLDVPQMDDIEEWNSTLRAMSTIGLSQAEQSNILRMLAIVLWLGNSQYAENKEGNA